MDRIRILAINPGSTSTKIALFDDDEEVFSTNIEHAVGDMKGFKEIQDQLGYRRDLVRKEVEDRGLKLAEVDVFVGRGGGLCSVTGGTYEVSDVLIDHASRGMAGQHPAQLASQICRQFAETYGKRAFIVNPPAVDELEDIARVSGVKGIYRESHVHALNQKEIALRFCKARGMKYEEANLILLHLGGGISVTAHRRGHMVDTNDIIKGSGPMTPTRSGDLPYAAVIEMAYSGAYTKKELMDKLNKNGGLTDHFGTADVRAVVKMIEEGDPYAKVVMDGMVYQTAKYAGAMAVALKGQIDAVIVTGGMAGSQYAQDLLRDYLGWLAELVVMPGEFEMEALAAGALRVLRGEEEAKTYTGMPVWNGF